MHRLTLMKWMNKRFLVLSITWNNHLTVLISLHSNFILWGQHQVYHSLVLWTKSTGTQAKHTVGGGIMLSFGFSELLTHQEFLFAFRIAFQDCIYHVWSLRETQHNREVWAFSGNNLCLFSTSPPFLSPFPSVCKTGTDRRNNILHFLHHTDIVI